MHEAFFALQMEKQTRILNAAMKEFAINGYVNASTNHMVAAAGISKGALFHYFGSKMGLLEFLLQYSIQMIADKISDPPDKMPPDIIERWRLIAVKKVEILLQHPVVFDFLLRMAKEEMPEVKGKVVCLQETFVHEFKGKMYQDLDYSTFRTGIDVSRVLKLIWWTLEGYARELQAEISLDESRVKVVSKKALEETNAYLDLLKEAFYQ